MEILFLEIAALPRSRLRRLLSKSRADALCEQLMERLGELRPSSEPETVAATVFTLGRVAEAFFPELFENFMTPRNLSPLLGALVQLCDSRTATRMLNVVSQSFLDVPDVCAWLLRLPDSGRSWVNQLVRRCTSAMSAQPIMASSARSCASILRIIAGLSQHSSLLAAYISACIMPLVLEASAPFAVLLPSQTGNAYAVQEATLLTLASLLDTGESHPVSEEPCKRVFRLCKCAYEEFDGCVEEHEDEDSCSQRIDINWGNPGLFHCVRWSTCICNQTECSSRVCSPHCADKHCSGTPSTTTTTKTSTERGTFHPPLSGINSKVPMTPEAESSQLPSDSLVPLPSVECAGRSPCLSPIPIQGSDISACDAPRQNAASNVSTSSADLDGSICMESCLSALAQRASNVTSVLTLYGKSTPSAGSGVDIGAPASTTQLFARDLNGDSPAVASPTSATDRSIAVLVDEFGQSIFVARKRDSPDEGAAQCALRVNFAADVPALPEASAPRNAAYDMYDSAPFTDSPNFSHVPVGSHLANISLMSPECAPQPAHSGTPSIAAIAAIRASHARRRRRIRVSLLNYSTDCDEDDAIAGGGSALPQPPARSEVAAAACRDAMRDVLSCDPFYSPALILSPLAHRRRLGTAPRSGPSSSCLPESPRGEADRVRCSLIFSSTLSASAGRCSLMPAASAPPSRSTPPAWAASWDHYAPHYSLHASLAQACDNIGANDVDVLLSSDGANAATATAAARLDARPSRPYIHDAVAKPAPGKAFRVRWGAEVVGPDLSSPVQKCNSTSVHLSHCNDENLGLTVTASNEAPPRHHRTQQRATADPRKLCVGIVDEPETRKGGTRCKVLPVTTKVSRALPRPAGLSRADDAGSVVSAGSRASGDSARDRKGKVAAAAKAQSTLKLIAATSLAAVVQAEVAFKAMAVSGCAPQLPPARVQSKLVLRPASAPQATLAIRGSVVRGRRVGIAFDAGSSRLRDDEWW